MLSDSLYNPWSAQNIQETHEARMVNDVGINIPTINVTLEDKQANHISTMVEIKCTIINQFVSL